VVRVWGVNNHLVQLSDQRGQVRHRLHARLVTSSAALPERIHGGGATKDGFYSTRTRFISCTAADSARMDFVAVPFRHAI
jgi:hypothetical protein